MKIITIANKKCLARCGRTKTGNPKFCNRPTTYNDLCRPHDRRFMRDQKFNRED